MMIRGGRLSEGARPDMMATRTVPAKAERRSNRAWMCGGWVGDARCSVGLLHSGPTCLALLRPLLPHGSPKQGTKERMQMPMPHLVSLVCVVSFFRIVCVALRHKITTRLAYKLCCLKPHTEDDDPPFFSCPSFMLLLT